MTQNKYLRKIKWAHQNRLAGFKRLLNSKKWTLARYNFEVARWTERFNWDYKNHKTFYHIYITKWHRYRITLHKLLWSNKISSSEFHRRYQAAKVRSQDAQTHFTNYTHKRM